MELLYVSLLSIFVVLVSLLLHFLFFNKPSAAALPPGKYGWPAVGETLAFLSTGWNGHPEKFIFDRVIKYSSAIFRTHLFGERTTIFTGSGGNKFLFSNENKLLRVWWPASVDKFFPFAAEISSTRTEEAIKMRKMLSGFLKPESLQRYIGIMDEMAQRHFADGWENREEVAVLHLTENYTFLLACRLFVSMDDADDVKKFAEPFKKLVAGMISIPIDLPGTQFNKGIKAAKFIRRELAAIMKQRKIELTEGKASASQDVMSHMLVTRDENGKVMHELGVVDSILGLLVAGHDTVSSACAFVVNYLADLPHIYEGVYKEQMEIAKSKKVGELLNWDDIQKMKYSWNVVCEVLRLKPPLPGAFREALTDFMFNGFTIPKGWKIYYSANSTHLNPDYFPNPQKFDPSRYEGAGPEPYTFVPFGGGSRMCPGKEYARLEILVFVHNLVKRFRFEKLIPDEKIVVNPIPLPTKGLPVRLYPHIHKP